MKANSVGPGSTLDEEFDGASHLLQLLQQEHEQLLDAEIGKLEQLTEKKLPSSFVCSNWPNHVTTASPQQVFRPQK
jgi:hypothetical protein